MDCVSVNVIEDDGDLDDDAVNEGDMVVVLETV